MSKPFYTELKNRGLINIEGDDHIEFLQGLISQDVSKLEQKPYHVWLFTDATGEILA